MLKKHRVLVYLTQILCVRPVENKVGIIVSKIDIEASAPMFSKFPNRVAADFPRNGLSVSKAAYFRKRYYSLYKSVSTIPENPVGINRHSLAIKFIESKSLSIGKDGNVMGIANLNVQEKYEILEKLIGIYKGKIRVTALAA